MHGHTIIGLLTDIALRRRSTARIRYADDLVIAIDGGRYDGGPLLLVELT